MITVGVIALLAGVVSYTATFLQKNSRDSVRDTKARIISNALEKYYRKNNEYPSVALMTSSDVTAVRQRLAVPDADIFKFPLASASNSIKTNSPSPTQIVYMANTTDPEKNAQCQTDVNGYCDGFSLQYREESSGGLVAIMSLHGTFTQVADEPSGPGGGSSPPTCNEGDAQSGTTCTHTYAATYQQGYYTCQPGDTLSSSVCTSSYAATYTPPPAGIAVANDLPAIVGLYSSGSYQCTHSTSSLCTQATITIGDTSTSYQCTNSTSSLCRQATYTVSNPPQGQYSCPNGGNPSSDKTLCYVSYNAAYTEGYYTCAQGGTLNGTSCTYTYQLGS